MEPKVNAFAALAADKAMLEAKSAETALKVQNGCLGPLHVIPVTIKDLTSVKGFPFQRGSQIEAGNIGVVDAAFVSRLRAAGAIVVGKTTTSEFGWKGVSHRPRQLA